MKICDQRRHARLRKKFRVNVRKRGFGTSDVSLDGHTSELSQGDAFIETEGWHLFKPDDLTDLIFFLPSDFTGVEIPIGLQGSAIVRRVDRSREGIAVEFTEALRRFIRVVMS